MRIAIGIAVALCSATLLPAIAAAQTANQDYVAMGDSYSAGTGTSNYDPGPPDCERSPYAYGPLLDPTIPGTFAHVACGGAKIAHIDTSQQKTGAPKQIDWLGAGTDYVSLTVGGNDAGFGDVILECAKPSWLADCDAKIDDAQAYIQNTMPARLTTAYTKIRQSAPNATVSVLGYPRLFNTRGEDCNAGTFFSSGELNRLNATADLMADAMRARAQAAGFSFVDSRPAFAGHGVCDDEWINGLSNPTSNSYHPNQAGYVGFKGIVGATLLAAPRPNQTTGPNARIAFASNRDGDSEIYTVNANGAFPVNLTSNGAADVDPEWSPDGTKLAFASDRDGDNEIYLLSFAAGTVTKLTSNSANDREPTFSPNGDLIAFRSDRTGNNEVFRMTVSGGSQTNLTNSAGSSDFAPDWSPDGSEIVYQRYISGDGNEVMRMSSDGQGQTDLSNNAANDGRPVWAPSGNAISFHSNRDGDFELFTMSRSGSSVVQRTANGADDRAPSYAPDGASLAFQSDRGGSAEIYTAAVSGAGAWPAQRQRTDVASGQADATPSWQGDQTAPETSIDSGPSGTINLATPSFEFSSSEPGSTFQCRIDGGAFTACGSPHTTASLGDGPRTFQVRATDPAGNADATPASRSFTIDATPATTAITSGPSGFTAEQTPTFEFASDDPLATFVCRVDSDAFAPCTSPHTTASLDDGEHTFSVRGTDGAGNPDPQPVSVSFTVDTTPPETVIDAAPSGIDNDPRPSFSFSSEPGATFECRIDSGAENDFEPCSSPLRPPELADGAHSFEVRATDPAGNTDPSPASASFSIDTEAPETTITSAAPARTDDAPTLEFTATEPGSFECRLDSADDADWTPCSSPHSIGPLADGDHSFEVRATDGAANADATPASLSFSTDTTAPETTIDSGPGSGSGAGLTADSTPTWTFSADDPEPSYECRIDSEPWQACDQTFTAAALDDGPHSFEVRAGDEFGNVDQTPASATFTVDTTGPDTEITAGPQGLIADRTPSFSFASDEGDATFECRLDGGGWQRCEPPHELGPLGDGDHELEVRASDDLGNPDPTPAARTFSVDATAPGVTISAKRRQRVRGKVRVKVRVTVDERAEVSAGATVVRRSRSVPFAVAHRAVATGIPTTVKLVPRSARGARLIRRATKRGERPRVRVTVIVTDSAGNETTVRQRLRLRQRQR